MIYVCRGGNETSFPDSNPGIGHTLEKKKDVSTIYGIIILFEILTNNPGWCHINKKLLFS